jgi:hypothetical protein
MVLKKLPNDVHVRYDDIYHTYPVTQLESAEKVLSNDAHIIFDVTHHT